MNKNVIPWLYGIGAALLVILIVAIIQANPKNSSNKDNDLLAITEQDNIKGKKSAQVTLIEYSDFQCPACATYAPVVQAMNEKFDDKLLIVYRHLPLVTIHQNALPAARAAQASALQGKFWEMHDMLFEQQSTWSPVANPDAYFEQYARDLALDMEKFKADYESESVADRVETDRKSATALSLSSTPSFLLNGEVIRPTSDAHFASLIEAVLNNVPAPEVKPEDLASAKDVHEHIDFAIYIQGKKVDLSLGKYQSDPLESKEDDGHNHKEIGHTHDPYVHLHDNKGTIVHKHKEGVTLWYFLKTIGMELSKTCLTVDTGEKYCTDTNNSLKFFVNGVRNQGIDDYELHDLDRVLISYGPLSDGALQYQIKSIPDEACIYSQKCPQRGKAPPETCVGGTGVPCTE